MGKDVHSSGPVGNFGALSLLQDHDDSQLHKASQLIAHRLSERIVMIGDLSRHISYGLMHTIPTKLKEL